MGFSGSIGGAGEIFRIVPDGKRLGSDGAISFRWEEYLK